jgi:hypothetical protein
MLRYSAIFIAWGGGTWWSRNRSLEGLKISIWYRLLPVASHKSHMPKPFIAFSIAIYVKKFCDFCCMLSGEVAEFQNKPES